ncbi:MAG: heavy-metal-associated domain-containing protein [Nitrospinota bacterium]
MGCLSAIERALDTIPGVQKVEGDVKTKRVEVLTGEEVEAEEIIRTMDRVGFPVEA